MKDIQIILKSVFERIENDKIEAIILKKLLAVKKLPQKIEVKGNTKLEIKEAKLNVILLVVHELLKDNEITENESTDIEFIKLSLGVKEGDFKKFRSVQFKMNEIIIHQIKSMYNDFFIDKKESKQKVNLQGVFDLGYDDFLEITKQIDIDTLNSGANLLDLDTFIKEKYLS